MSDPILVSKVTLPTGKVVYIKDANLGHIEKATQLAGKVAKDNQPYFGMLMQKELLKMMIVQIDDKKLSMVDKEQINKMFSLKEYKMLLNFVADMTGMGEELGNLQVEQETFGDK